MEINNSFKCCFCSNSIASSHLDVTSLVVTESWDKLEEEQQYHQYYCHLRCFKEKLHPTVPLYLELLGEDDGYEDDRTEEEIRESLNAMLQPSSPEVVEAATLHKQVEQQLLVYECCFCANSIASSSVNITSLLVTINCDKDVELQQDQQFFCHLNCFDQIVKK